MVAASDQGVIVVSFGSVAPANGMPLEWKQSFVGLAKKMPKYTFIWKYETPDDLGQSHCNMLIYIMYNKNPLILCTDFRGASWQAASKPLPNIVDAADGLARLGCLVCYIYYIPLSRKVSS